MPLQEHFGVHRRIGRKPYQESHMVAIRNMTSNDKRPTEEVANYQEDPTTMIREITKS